MQDIEKIEAIPVLDELEEPAQETDPTFIPANQNEEVASQAGRIILMTQAELRASGKIDGYSRSSVFQGDSNY
jgi:hypothetical protein